MRWSCHVARSDKCASNRMFTHVVSEAHPAGREAGVARVAPGVMLGDAVHRALDELLPVRDILPRPGAELLLAAELDDLELVIWQVVRLRARCLHDVPPLMGATLVATTLPRPVAPDKPPRTKSALV